MVLTPVPSLESLGAFRRVASHHITLLTLLSDSEGSNDDASLDDVPAAVADSEAKQQLNGDLEDDVDKIDVPAGQGEVEDHVDSESDGFEPGPGEYSVEEIRAHSVVKGKAFYEIKWKHYPDDENTWEPEANLLP